MSRHSHLYKTKGWLLRRKDQLERDPLCAYCLTLGHLTPATVADHTTPHGGNVELFGGELQSLCKHCHDSIKQREEKSGYRAGCDKSGIPIDTKHHWNA